MKTIYICHLSSGSTVLSFSKTTSTEHYSLSITDAKNLQEAYGSKEGTEVPNEIFDAFKAKEETLELYITEKNSEKRKLWAAELSTTVKKEEYNGKEYFVAYLKTFETIYITGISVDGFFGFNNTSRSKARVRAVKFNNYPFGDFLNAVPVKKAYFDELAAKAQSAA